MNDKANSARHNQIRETQGRFGNGPPNLRDGSASGVLITD
jgi:hypothetical protein